MTLNAKAALKRLDSFGVSLNPEQEARSVFFLKGRLFRVGGVLILSVSCFFLFYYVLTRMDGEGSSAGGGARRIGSCDTVRSGVMRP